MADMFAAGAAYLNQQMKANGATELTYRRDSQTVAIKMTIGEPKIPLFSVLGSVPGSLDPTQDNPINQVRGFTFEAADLDFGAGAVLPESGDEILETIGGVVNVFTVRNPNNGKLCWERSSDYRGEGARIIVRAELTGTE